MSNWRPEGWEHQRNDDCKTCVSYGLGNRDCVICQRNYEAGADAMLRALRKLGHHVNASAPFSSLVEHTTLSKNNTGTYVFIPDDVWSKGNK